MIMKNILLFTSHPDDAEIAMGGTIMKFVDQGFRVKNIIASIPFLVDIRKKETELSSAYMNIEYEFLAENPFGVEGTSIYQLVEKFDKFIEEYQPDMIFTHYDQDSHQDHRLVSKAVQVCLRKFKCDLYFIEQTNQSNLLKSNNFVPNTYVDISDYLEKKMEAFKFHQSQLKGYMKHYLDDIKMLAQWRGYQINTTYAESFKLLLKREII